jgi:hypothetical protein
VVSARVSVYIYYRVDADDVSAAVHALRGLGCTVSRRADESGAAVTLMERYSLDAMPTPAWLAHMHQSARAALAACHCSERHTEVFVDLA